LINKNCVVRIIVMLLAIPSGLSVTSCRIARVGGRALLGQPEIPVDLAQARVRLSYNLRQGTFGVVRVHNSIRLSRMATAVTIGQRTYTSTDKGCRNRIAHRDVLRLIILSSVANGPAWETRFEIKTHSNEGNATLDRALRDAYGVSVTCRLVGDAPPGLSPRFSLAGSVLTEVPAFACRLAPQAGYQPAPPQAGYQPVPPLQIAVGDVAGGLNSGFYDPERDCAVHLGAPRVAIRNSRPRTGGKSFPVRLDFDSVAAVNFAESFYKTVHGFGYFDGSRPSDFPRPVAGWLDWYVTYGKTSETAILRNADWLAEHLRDFGLEAVQIDDGWQAAYPDRLPGRLGNKATDWLHAASGFPRGMAWLAQQIHARGFLAGIWLVPYATNDATLLRAHRDWFLKGSDGAPQTAQGRWAEQFGYLLDLANPEVRHRYLTPLFKTLSSDWGYDYFKLDATGWTLLAIKDQTFRERRFAKLKIGQKIHSGAEVVRDGLDAIRSAIGGSLWSRTLGRLKSRPYAALEKKFVLACHAPCPEAVGLVDAARVAGDMAPGWDRGVLHLLRQTMDSFHAHRVCWINDPDCLVMRPLTVEQARVFATMFGLTGQHLMLSDEMSDLGEEKVELLRRILPVLATHPLDLYSRDTTATVWDLKIRRPFAAWDVVGVFNFGKQAAPRTVRLADLGLATTGTYIVYDFWNRRCLGRIENEVSLELPPTACRVLAIHRQSGAPQIISTNRHISQGGVDLLDVLWDPTRSELSGRSRVVGGDPYELRLWVPEGFRPAGVTSTAPQAALDAAGDGRSATARLTGHPTGEARWLIRFETAKTP